MSAELTSVILLELGRAANPWGIMIAVLLLEARRGHAIVWTFVVAWVGAITVVLAALLAGVGAIFEQGSDSATTAASVAELVLGLALLSWGAARVVHARRVVAATGSGDAPAQPGTPGWLHAIENISYPAAFLLGIYSATYPLVIAAAGEILRSDASTAETVVLASLFVVLGSSSVAAVATLGTFARPDAPPSPRATTSLANRPQPGRDHRDPPRLRDRANGPRSHRPQLTSTLRPTKPRTFRGHAPRRLGAIGTCVIDVPG